MQRLTILTRLVAIFLVNGDPLLENHKDFGLTESQYVSLKKFRDNFRDFSDRYYHPYEFIDTPKWNEITEMAKEVLKAFHYQEAQKMEGCQLLLKI